MIVTIDGPAGAGKSSISRRLADSLGFAFLDTGAMYRAVALLGLRADIDWKNTQQLTELAQSATIDLSGSAVLLNGEDVSQEIRTQRVTAVTRFAANNVGVREQLVERQRAFADAPDIVTEGRDQGTLVFPHAQCKIYLTASPEERARRRVHDLAGSGAETVEFQKILQQQTLRDQEDMQREVGPLLKADDAIEVLTDGMTEEEVLQTLIKIVRRCQNA